MYARSFEERLDRLQWQPDSTPTREIVESMLPASSDGSHIRASLLGGICGTATGLAVKAAQLGAYPFGDAEGPVALLVMLVIYLAFAAAPVLAIAGALLHKRVPGLLPFAGINLLVIAAALLS